MNGIVTRLVRNRGFGFLKGDDGIERFFHRSSVRPWVNFDALSEEDRIIFEEDRSPKGPRAKHIDLFDQPDQSPSQSHDHTTQAVAEKRHPHEEEAEIASRARLHRRHPAPSLRPRR